LVHVDPSLPAPLYQQIYHSLRASIVNGTLPAGTRLPTTRMLASELGVSRNTAASAMELLRAEGYVEVRDRAGTFVCAVVPENVLHATRGAAEPVVAGAASAHAGEAPPRLSESGRLLMSARSRLLERTTEPFRPFRIALPAFDAFPIDVWNRIANRMDTFDPHQYGYGTPLGHPGLREAIAAYVTVARGAHCTKDEVVITSGAQQALDIIARMLLNPGDDVWVEDPGYPGARAAFAATGAVLSPINVDDEGMDIGSAPAGSTPRLIYVTPSHQYPSGVTMSQRRRAELLRFADAGNCWVVEDDYDSEFRYVSRPLPCMQGMDRNGRVIYVGTFSKMLFPGLRLGYMVLPKPLVEPAGVIRAITDRHSSMPAQAVLAEFIRGGHLASHLRRMKLLYDERRNALVDAMRIHTPGLKVAEAGAGLHLVARLPSHLNEIDVAAAAAHAGIDVAPLSKFVWGRQQPATFLLGFAAFPASQLVDAVKRLAPLVRPASSMKAGDSEI
jgi:GntR family transcriptional regulator/MocR family aminotransferase